MPRITTFEAPESLGLRPTETGISAMAAAARRVQGEFNEAAAAQERTGQFIGSGIATAGATAVRYVEHQEVSRGANAFASMAAAKNKEWDDTAKNADPNDPTVGRRFMAENLEPDLEKFKTGFLTEGGQKWADSHTAQLRQHMFNKTSADMATLAGEAVKTNVRQTINNLSNTVRGDPASVDFAISTLNSCIGAIADTSTNLNAAQAAKVRGEVLQSGTEAIVKSAAAGYIEKTGEVPPWATDKKYSPYVDGMELKQMERAAKTYQRAQLIDQKTLENYQQQQDKRAARAEMSKAYTDFVTYDQNDQPVVLPGFAKKILEIESKYPGAETNEARSLIREVQAINARFNKPEPLSSVSHETTMDLLRRMRATDDTRISDLNPVYDAFEDGRLNRVDFKFLQDEFRGMRSPEGQKLTQTKADFFKAVGASIDKSNPLMGKTDQDGKLNLYRFEWDINRKIDEYRKAGKNPYDLFDPSKPDYMGTPKALEAYQKPLQQSIQDTARRLGVRPPGEKNLTGPGKTITGIEVTPAPEPAKPLRKPGESADEYLKRIGM